MASKKLAFIYFIAFIGIIAIFNFSCNNDTNKESVNKPTVQTLIEDTVVFNTPALTIVKVAPNSYIHKSYLHTNDFGKVDCNGMIITDNKEAVIYDTPTNDTVAQLLIDFLKDSLQLSIKAVVVTHFHKDCLGGLQSFHNDQIPSYASKKTIELARNNNLIIPQIGIDSILNLHFGNTNTELAYLGAGHTSDNIIGYFEKDKILFGGCLVKCIGANAGYLGDANTKVWPNTIKNIQDKYPNLKIVIPGHGNWGDTSLLSYTKSLIDSINNNGSE